jgi:hypothetical protein
MTLEDVKEEYGSLPPGEVVSFGPYPFDETIMVTTTPVLLSPMLNLWQHNGDAWVAVDQDQSSRICNAARLDTLIKRTESLPEKVRLVNLRSQIGERWEKHCAYVFKHPRQARMIATVRGWICPYCDHEERLIL